MTELSRRARFTILPMFLLAGLFLGACGSGGVMAQAAALRRLAPQQRSWRSSFNKAISKRQILMLTISLDSMSRFPVTRWSSEHRRKAAMRLE